MVHFRGTPEGKTQVLGGNIEVYACNVSEGAEDVKAGVIRPLGVMSPTRSKFMPNVPTFREQGLNEVWSTSRGIAAPAGLPPDVEAALIAALEKTIGSAEHKAKAEALARLMTEIGTTAYQASQAAGEAAGSGEPAGGAPEGETIEGEAKEV